jgi:hypothetical protein
MNALNGEHSHLKSCVTSLHSGYVTNVPESFSDPQEAPVLQAYIHLPLGLGLTIQECEYGYELHMAPPAIVDGGVAAVAGQAQPHEDVHVIQV